MADDPNLAFSDISSIPTHPEEMKAVYNLRVGKSISLQGSARITPAGVVTIGITIAAITFACLAMQKSMR